MTEHCATCLGRKPEDPGKLSAARQLKSLEAAQAKLEQQLHANLVAQRKLAKKLKG
jgi:hypothetical protein